MAECGPMRLVISSFLGKAPQLEMNVTAAKEAFRCLERVAGYKDRLKRRISVIPDHWTDPLPLEMARSALRVADPELTPMAAVAGTISDAVADFLQDRGMTKVIVNNGGDIAIRLRGEESATVGIREGLESRTFSRVLLLDASKAAWGVATSGLGGRSLTRGIASAATVVAESASLADAAATSVANASFAADAQVTRRHAEEIDPDTDIPGLLVTTQVGALTEKAKTAALRSAMKRASALVQRGVISGVFLAVGGRVEMSDFIRTRLLE